MKYLENYKSSNIFTPKEFTYWFIEGDMHKVLSDLNILSDIYLNNKDADSLRSTILRALYYKENKCIGFFIYYSRHGFSFTILENMNQMVEMYKSQKDGGVYNYIGELKIGNNNTNSIIFDISSKEFLEDTIKYNLE